MTTIYNDIISHVIPVIWKYLSFKCNHIDSSCETVPPWNWNLSWWLFIKICFLEYAPPNFTVLNGYAKFLERRNHLDSNSISISRLCWTKKRNFLLNFSLKYYYTCMDKYQCIPFNTEWLQFIPLCSVLKLTYGF